MFSEKPNQLIRLISATPEGYGSAVSEGAASRPLCTIKNLFFLRSGFPNKKFDLKNI